MENTTIFAKLPGVMVSAKLVIKNFPEAMAMSKPGKCYSSETFYVGKIPMTLEIYPNGKVSTCENWVHSKTGGVSVGIFNESNENITVMGLFTTEASKMGFIRDVNARNRWGINNFLSHATCANVYKDIDFCLTATIEIAGQDLKVLGKEFAIAAPPEHDYRELLFKQMRDTNFKLIFRGTQMCCHKHILAATSPVFEAMFQGQYKENMENQCAIDVSEKVGRAFIHFMYLGKLDDDILGQEAVALFELGERYNIPALKHLAEGEMLRQLNRNNMLEILTIGRLFNAKTMFETALEMTKANLNWLHSQKDGRKKIEALSQDIKDKLNI